MVLPDGRSGFVGSVMYVVQHGEVKRTRSQSSPLITFLWVEPDKQLSTNERVSNYYIVYGLVMCNCCLKE